MRSGDVSSALRQRGAAEVACWMPIPRFRIGKTGRIYNCFGADFDAPLNWCRWMRLHVRRSSEGATAQVVGFETIATQREASGITSERTSSCRVARRARGLFQSGGSRLAGTQIPSKSRSVSFFAAQKIGDCGLGGPGFLAGLGGLGSLPVPRLRCHRGLLGNASQFLPLRKHQPTNTVCPVIPNNGEHRRSSLAACRSPLEFGLSALLSSLSFPRLLKRNPALAK